MRGLAKEAAVFVCRGSRPKWGLPRRKAFLMPDISQTTAFFGSLAGLLALLGSTTRALRNRRFTSLEHVRTALSAADGCADSPLRRSEQFRLARLEAHEDLRPLLEARRRESFLFGSLSYLFAALAAFVGVTIYLTPPWGWAEWPYLILIVLTALGLCAGSVVTFANTTIVEDEEQRRFGERFLNPDGPSPFGVEPQTLGSLGSMQPRALVIGASQALLTTLSGSSTGFLGIGLLAPSELPTGIIAGAGTMLIALLPLLVLSARHRPLSTETIWRRSMQKSEEQPVSDIERDEHSAQLRSGSPEPGTSPSPA